MTHKTAGLRGKLRLLTIIGFSLVLLVCGGIVALFLFDIEDVIYARGKIASEIAYDIIGHMDGRVIRLNFEEGDDVEAGEVIALLDTILYDEQRVRIEAELREYEAELEVKKAELEALRTNPLPKELWYAETNLKESEDQGEADAGEAEPFAAAVEQQRDFEARIRGCRDRKHQSAGGAGPRPGESGEGQERDRRTQH